MSIHAAVPSFLLFYLLFSIKKAFLDYAEANRAVRGAGAVHVACDRPEFLILALQKFQSRVKNSVQL
jgi:hypothetical protein